ncbi:MAG TPA: hypothetical protein DEA55_08280 [Rhodospirillaceae bacterium]|nr:hypothetical protein [Rhodospirillaceae bacterium]
MLEPLRILANNFLSPLLVLGIRLFMADIFFTSGLIKFKSFLNGQWDTTVYLFRDVHPLPGIPAELAAIGGTGGELVLPILLALGLFGRAGAAGLLVMTAVIQFAIPAEYGLMNADHYLWMMLLAVPLVMGPGKFSLDHLLLKFIRKS